MFRTNAEQQIFWFVLQTLRFYIDIIPRELILIKKARHFGRFGRFRIFRTMDNIQLKHWSPPSTKCPHQEQFL